MSTNQVSPGPKRWQRAIDNALVKPESANAKLLLSRLKSVDTLNMNPAFWAITRTNTAGTRNRYYCSDFCVGLALHLEWLPATTPVTQYVDKARDHFGQTGLDSHTVMAVIDELPRASVKCFVCGGTMSKNRSVSKREVDFTPALELLNEMEETAAYVEPVFPSVDEMLKDEQKKVKVLIDYDGKILSTTPEVREVELTVRERRLFDYVPAHLRHEVLSQLEQL